MSSVGVLSVLVLEPPWKFAVVVNFLSPSVKVTSLVPGVKHFEFCKSTTPADPPTLNVKGNLTVPVASVLSLTLSLAVHFNCEYATTKSPGSKRHVAYTVSSTSKSTLCCVVVNLNTHGMFNVNVSPGLTLEPKIFQDNCAIQLGAAGVLYL